MSIHDLICCGLLLLFSKYPFFTKGLKIFEAGTCSSVVIELGSIREKHMIWFYYHTISRLQVGNFTIKLYQCIFFFCFKSLHRPNGMLFLIFLLPVHSGWPTDLTNTPMIAADLTVKVRISFRRIIMLVSALAKGLWPFLSPHNENCSMSKIILTLWMDTIT